MAFPWTFSEGFENGTRGSFDSEVDTNSKLDFPHYSEIPRITGLRETAYKGAYAMHINLALGTADAYIQEDAGFDAAATVTVAVRFYFLASGLTMAASDAFTIFAFQSGAGTDEAIIRIVNNAGTIQIQGGNPDGGGTFRAATLVQDVWHSVEMVCLVDSGVGNDGTIDFYLDGGQVGAQVTTADQAAFTQARMGAIDIDAGTTAGRLLFDEVVGDDARVNQLNERFPSIADWVSHDQHIMVGRGIVGLSMTAESTDGVCTVYDTDSANSGVTATPIYVLRNTAEHEVVDSFDIEFHRGCFLDIGGTNPQVSVQFRDGQVFSKGQKLNLAMRRQV